MVLLNSFRAPKSLPVLISNKIVKKGFPVVKALTFLAPQFRHGEKHLELAWDNFRSWKWGNSRVVHEAGVPRAYSKPYASERK